MKELLLMARDFYTGLYLFARVQLQGFANWWESHPFLFNLLKVAFAFIASLWGDLFTFIIAILALTFIDTHLGIKVAKRVNKDYNSKLRRKGLVDKTLLYMTIVVVTLLLDLMMRQIYDVGDYYITMVISFFIGLYEATSIIEKMKVLHPNNKVVSKIGKIFLLIDENLEKKVIDKIDKVDEILKTGKDEDAK